ncbi:hypothetical protein L484_024783 [Morus notabilis]|uniref:DC1 domain-containing protein n=1 Tax=Morus notabilis TaxID=981085 RepID=W9R4I3_9ROSA|nr:hypothetical protein L484_024783 [Morus notabilis]
MKGSNYKANTIKKSRTFQLTKSPTMDYNNQLPARTATTNIQAPKKPAVVEFPTSPQLIFGEEMLHFGHPRHPLSLVKLPDLFTCAGCKEYGSGKRFVCQQCDFQLHDFCASAPPTLKAHPLHYQHQLILFSKPVKGQSKCDVCNKPCKGYAYRCSACSFQMHPCCAMLKTEMSLLLAHAHTLRLQPADQHNNDVHCGECNRKRSSGRVYHCTYCGYHIHAVMIDFIGGLIEGLAEGVGQVIVQDAAKGRSNAARRSGN